jgi:hypothetical protein
MLLSAGIIFILGLLLGGALMDMSAASSQAFALALLPLSPVQLLNGLGVLVILLASIPAGIFAITAALTRLFLIPRQDLSGVVAHTEPQS